VDVTPSFVTVLLHGVHGSSPVAAFAVIGLGAAVLVSAAVLSSLQR
jgi:predicted exporter